MNLDPPLIPFLERKKGVKKHKGRNEIFKHV